MPDINSTRNIVSVIMAAGKGTRMKVPYLHKVCFQIEGRPVITRSIEGFRRCGVETHLVVVGPMAEQVMQAAAMAPANVIYCFQPEQRGTGNAARVAAQALRAMDYQGDVLITAGDKALEDSIVLKLLEVFRRQGSDLAFVVGDVRDFSSAGRIICSPEGRVLGNVEVFDIARMQLLIALRRITDERIATAQEVKGLALSYLKTEKKASLAIGALWDAVSEGQSVTREMLQGNYSEADFSLRLNDANHSPELLSSVRYANLSVYLVKAPALYRALERLSSDNAQREEYLTDIIGILAAEGCRVDMVPVDYPQQAMAFNTPEELREIQDYVAGKQAPVVETRPRAIRPVEEWLRIFETTTPASVRYLGETYGQENPNIAAKRRMIVAALRSHRERYGDEPVLIARSPARVNIMGRHVDHQGGFGNMVAIDKDFYLIAGAREDRAIHLRNLEPHYFPDRVLDINELLSDYPEGGTWREFVDGEPVKKRIAAAYGDWSHYIAAPVLRFQAEFPHRRIQGMNILAAGDVPVAAGLSSSSALVVAAAEALTQLNAIDLTAERFVELCGEGEWYVGTRGGAGDHAAMKFAQKGRVVQVGFYPFRVHQTVDFPAGHILAICNSQQKARKTQGAKDVFNHRVACYHLGRELLKQEFPKFAPAIEHLRDFNVRNLGVDYPELLGMLKRIPTVMSRRELTERLAPEVTEKYLASHSASLDSYPIRPVVMFGLSECERSREAPRLLGASAVAEFGRWMNLSHDGDRVVSWDDHDNSWPFTVDYSDAGLEALIARAGDARRVGGDGAAYDGAGLTLQPGAYSCSIPQIDRMIDIARQIEGVAGAQLSGAGLGGCIMVLAREAAAETIEKTMLRRYYAPAGLDPALFISPPVAGSGLVVI